MSAGRCQLHLSRFAVVECWRICVDGSSHCFDLICCCVCPCCRRCAVRPSPTPTSFGRRTTDLRGEACDCEGVRTAGLGGDALVRVDVSIVALVFIELAVGRPEPFIFEERKVR